MMESYQILFSVQLLHSYFNSGSAQQALTIVPTQQTAHLLKRIGLNYRVQADGISILYPKERAADYLDYLGMEQMTKVFCFQVLSKDEQFYNYTQLNYPGNGYLLAYHSSRVEPMNDGKQRLLLAEYNAGFAQFAQSLSTQGLTKLQGPERQDITWSDEASLSLGYHGEGVYTATVAGQEQEFCYFNKGLQALPLALLCVHLDETYRLVLEIASRGPAYDMQFEARKTFWRYLVKNADGERDLSKCRVEGNNVAFQQKELQDAMAFESEQEILLQERYKQAFSLRNGGVGRAVVDRLPGATAQLIRPEGQKIYSEIHVHI